jgi:hypothetical protein
MRITEYTQPGATRYEVVLLFFGRDSVTYPFQQPPSDELVKELVKSQYAKGAQVVKYEESTKYYSEY